jgi:hypothetical protein
MTWADLWVRCSGPIIPSDLAKMLSPYAGSTFWALAEKGPQDEDNEQGRLTV